MAAQALEQTPLMALVLALVLAALALEVLVVEELAAEILEAVVLAQVAPGRAVVALDQEAQAPELLVWALALEAARDLILRVLMPALGRPLTPTAMVNLMLL